MKKVSIKIILYTSKVNKDGKSPVVLRLTYQRKRKFFFTKYSTTPEYWDTEHGRFVKDRELKKLNKILTAYEAKAHKIVDDLGTGFSFDLFEERLHGRNVKQMTVVQYLENIQNDFYSKDKRSTGNTYRDTISALKRFKASKKMFTDITPAFLNKFETFLRTKAGTATISIYMRCIRRAFNDAIADGIVPAEAYPFGRRKFLIRSKKAKSKMALNKGDMLKIMKTKSKEGTQLRNSINYFVFSYLTRGMNFKDMCLLKWDDIQGDRLSYIRKKTEETDTVEEEITIKITPAIADIIAQYSGNEPYIFPVLEEGLSEKTAMFRRNNTLKKLNKDIKEVAAKLKIPGADKITFYCSRHTYATVLLNGGVGLSEISESLGHSSIKTTEGYLHSLSDKLDANDELLL